MTDYYKQLTHSPVGKRIAAALGLHPPPRLTRAQGSWPDKILAGKSLLFGATAKAQLLQPILAELQGMDAAVDVPAGDSALEFIRKTADKLGLAVNVSGSRMDPNTGEPKAHALVFDASGIQNPNELRELYDFFHPSLRNINANGRVILLGTTPSSQENVAEAAAAQALEGFTRSLAKEMGRKGISVQLIYVEPGAEQRLAGPLRFFMSEHSAFITGQPLHVNLRVAGDYEPKWTLPLDGKTALVTGAARGIGEAIARTLAREGAKVVCLDRPGEEKQLAEVTGDIGGTALLVDITDNNAPQKIAEALNKTDQGVDIVVHNAGVTRDKTLGRMSPEWWDMVLNINLASILRIDEKLTDGVIREDGRIVCVSSIGGIAGNAGQTNYGASKAGIIGYVRAQSRALAPQRITVNAIAPGFIETQMTAAMPMIPREAGRRMSSFSQGGLPQDVAEAITFMASPGAQGVNGEVLRVCGQMLVGA